MSKCDECEFQLTKIMCNTCMYLPDRPDNFSKKKNPLQNLFIGAPVMVMHALNTTWFKQHYSKGDTCFSDGSTYWNYTNFLKWNYMRLPSVPESPRNTWLAAPHDGKCPDGAERLIIMVWEKNMKAPFAIIKRGEDLSWKHVAKFMIIDLEAFAK